MMIMIGKIRQNAKKILLMAVLATIAACLSACSAKDDQALVGKNPAVLALIERVPFELPEFKEEPKVEEEEKKEPVKDKAVNSHNGKDFLKFWKSDNGGVTITQDENENYLAISEKGNRTDKYEIEIMQSYYNDNQLFYSGSQKGVCTYDDNNQEVRDASYGGDGILELHKKVPEDGASGKNDAYAWDTIADPDTKEGKDPEKYLYWERYY